MSEADISYDWKEVVKNSEIYKSFTILEKPERFRDMYAGEDIVCVELYSTQTYERNGHVDIVGFCGTFEWKNGEIISLDGDSYNENLMVLGYDRDDKYLDILVDNDW